MKRINEITLNRYINLFTEARRKRSPSRGTMNEETIHNGGNLYTKKKTNETKNKLDIT